jgi:glycosyltransferase involved in cell wall biosynthesis
MTSSLPGPTERTTLIDARWLPKSGAGTLTRSLLQGFTDVQPAGHWVIWGRESLMPPLWPAAVSAETSVDPADWFGQRSALRVPRADLVFHPHQTRPMHLYPAVTCVLDLIQLSHPSAPIRLAMTLRLRASLAAARALFTISESVRQELVADFGVDPAAVATLPVPIDRAAAQRVAARRAEVEPGRVILAIGRFFRHKNHRRLIAGFARSQFAATGGELHLVGDTADRLDVGTEPLHPQVCVLGVVDKAGLEEAMARALVVVQASVAEGYGLPVAEALAAGIPVTSSPIPAVTEYGPTGVPLFDPTSAEEISAAIDETVELVETGCYWERVDRAPWLAALPTTRALAEHVIDGLDRAALRI